MVEHGNLRAEIHGGFEARSLSGDEPVPASVAIVDFPDEDPFEVASPVLAFNSDPNGPKPTIFFHAFTNLPQPTIFQPPNPISDAPGRAFGKRVTFNMPLLAGGNGRVVKLELKLGRTWRHAGDRRSYLLARCQGGDLTIRTALRFSDGSRLGAKLDRKCRARR